MSHSLRPPWTALPCPSLSPRACSNSCRSSRCHRPTISSSGAPFSLCAQLLPASGSFPMSLSFWACINSSPVSSEVSAFPLQVRTSLVAQTVKCLPTMRETRVQCLGQEDLPEKEMATHSSILVWKTPWTEDPGGLQSQRVGHD